MANSHMLFLPIIGDKVTNMANMSCIPFDIHKSNVQVVNKWQANVNYTFIIMVFFYQTRSIVSTKILIDGKIIHGHNLHDNLWIQMDSIVLISRSPLTTSNIKTHKKPTCVRSFFWNSPSIEKYPNILNGNTCAHLFVGFLSKWSFCQGNVGIFYQFFHWEKWLTSTCFFMVVKPLILWYAISSFPALGAHGQDIKPTKSLWQIIHLMIWLWSKFTSWLLFTFKNSQVNEV